MNYSILANVKRAFTGETQDLVDPYVQVCFAGMTGCTSVKKNSYTPVWNEQIVFTEMFPPLCQRIKIQLRDNDPVHPNIIGTHFIDLKSISNDGEKDEMSADTGYWQSTTAATKASSLSDKSYYYLPYWDHKQCMHVRSIWPDHRRRMYNSNLIANVIEKFWPGKKASSPSGWNIPAKISVYLWLGVLQDKKHYIDGLPQGYELSLEIRNADKLRSNAPAVIFYAEKHNAKRNPNFTNPVKFVDVELPDQDLYRPPLTIRVVDCRSFGRITLVGTHTINSIHKYIYTPMSKREKEIEERKKSLIQLQNVDLKANCIVHDDMFSVENEKENCPLLTREGRSTVSYGSGVRQSTRKRDPKGESFKKRKASTDSVLDDDERSKDWWTKYFASVECMIEEEKEAKKERQGYLQTPQVVFVDETRSPREEVHSPRPERDRFKRRRPLSPRAKLSPTILKKNEIPTSALSKIYPHELEAVSEFDEFKEWLHSFELYRGKKTGDDAEDESRVVGIFKDSMLTIQVLDWDLLGSDDMIGETKIDLENRFYSRHRATCGLPMKYEEQGYNRWRDAMKPTQILAKLCKDGKLDPPVYEYGRVKIGRSVFNMPMHDSELFSDVNLAEEQMALLVLRRWHELPRVGARLVPEHVETRPLYNPNKPGIEQGRLEMWVDMFPMDMPLPGPPMDISARKPKSYEMRVIIWNTDDVVLEDDAFFTGEKMSDIYVKGWVKGPDDCQATDIHYRSLTGEGNFNWRFIYPFDYLEAEERIVISRKESVFSWDETECKIPARLELQVWDADHFSADDFLGKIFL
ncbi:hypothetical protein MSG28_000832 [Choristoneura fumiferana]|uniref:Uncharacterized protein n=1 Tax=Choristoneura fumiferana TaxID=7141 RepID=A0ACC0K2P8_CHOFU|nr:hypothetical protein MSG28_000832 [Choristoneura fumiferana]